MTKSLKIHILSKDCDNSKQGSTIGESIKKCRQKLGIFQDILSKRANFTFYTIAKIETGGTPDPRIETVKKMRTH